MNDTDCRKCKTPMRRAAYPVNGMSVAKFQITGYLCTKCGHWNDLRRRKANKREAKES